MRAAIYYIFDILNCPSALYADTVTSGVMPSPYFFMGRDITQIVIHGTASGVGTLNTTDNKYYVDVEIFDILKDVTTTLNNKSKFKCGLRVLCNVFFYIYRISGSTYIYHY